MFYRLNYETLQLLLLWIFSPVQFYRRYVMCLSLLESLSVLTSCCVIWGRSSHRCRSRAIVPCPVNSITDYLTPFTKVLFKITVQRADWKITSDIIGSRRNSNVLPVSLILISTTNAHMTSVKMTCSKMLEYLGVELLICRCWCWLLLLPEAEWWHFSWEADQCL